MDFVLFMIPTIARLLVWLLELMLPLVFYRYTPGAWIETAGAMKRRNYDVPKTTTLLLVGPKGSGKSSLINRISKALEDDKFASERAQVSCMVLVVALKIYYVCCIIG